MFCLGTLMALLLGMANVGVQGRLLYNARVFPNVEAIAIVVSAGDSNSPKNASASPFFFDLCISTSVDVTPKCPAPYLHARRLNAVLGMGHDSSGTRSPQLGMRG